MALKHELCDTGDRVPELYTPVLGTREHPGAIRSESNTENKVLR